WRRAIVNDQTAGYIGAMKDLSTGGPVAVIGYGSQGHAVAQNLRDSGFDVIVGLRPDSPRRADARRDGMPRIDGIGAAVGQAGGVVFAFPDHRHGVVYRREIRDRLRPGAALVFLHGLSVHFGLVEPPEDADVILIAPHGPGVAVRANYLAGDRSMSAFVSVHRDSSGQAGPTMFGLAAGMGFDLTRLVPTTFEAEAVGDMFGEQAVLCGGLAALITGGFEVLVKNGIPPDAAYLEVAYQLDLIVALIKKHGIRGMFERISLTARYGSLETGPFLIDEVVKARMQQVYDRIASGEFVSRLTRLSEAQIDELGADLARLTDEKLEQAARKFKG
ncbi:MAG TPA: ketol-acid reductoisomerase, partial [candidate division Zixibacteria bacterium]|nr:ketol-acid reductoisomerase [candidate division Zixibacteria bacterium]